MNISKCVISTVLMWCVAACAAPQSTQQISLNPVNVFQVEDLVREEKNYALKKIHNVYVGDSIIRKKSFVDTIQTELVGKPNADISIRSRHNLLHMRKGEEFPVTHRANIGGRAHYVLELLHPTRQFIYGVLVDEQGVVSPNLLNGNVYHQERFAVSPLTASVPTVQKKTRTSSRMVENFEIIFGGINNNQMSFTYREFTADDIAKTAFFQNLTYPADSKVIRFKALKIKVHAITNESVTYEVLEE